MQWHDDCVVAIPVLYLLAGLSLGDGGILGVAAAGEFIATGAPIGVVLLLALGLEFSAAEFASSHATHRRRDIVSTPRPVRWRAAGVDIVAILRSGRGRLFPPRVIARLLEDRRLGNRGNAGCAIGTGARTSRWHRCSRFSRQAAAPRRSWA